MKITIDESPDCGQTEVQIRCARMDEQVLKMLALLRAFDQKITGTKDGQTFILDARDILYADSVDKKTFLYTAEGVFETPLRLYELEERLGPSDFFRASKAVVVNFGQIRSLRPEFGGRMLATMANGEIVYVSRQYVPVIKEKLGMK